LDFEVVRGTVTRLTCSCAIYTHLALKSDRKESVKETAEHFFLQKDYQNISAPKQFCLYTSPNEVSKEKKKKESRT